MSDSFSKAAFLFIAVVMLSLYTLSCIIAGMSVEAMKQLYCRLWLCKANAFCSSVCVSLCLEGKLYMNKIMFTIVIFTEMGF